MTVIAANSPSSQVGKFLVATTPMSGTITLALKSSVNQVLYLNNTTVSPVTVTIDGDGGTTVTLPGMGGTTDVSAGYAITIAANTVQAVLLSKIRNFTKGTVNLTGGVAGVLAWVHEG